MQTKIEIPPYIYGREAGENEKVWTEASVRALLSGLAELERDAARLDWMAKNLYWDGNAYWIPEICVRERGWGEEYTPEPTADEFRAAIDDATKT